MPKKPSIETLQAEIESLRQRAELAEETLAAIQRGEVDALVISHPDGQRIFTLRDTDRSYRVLVEQMGEGAVTVNEDGYILFCNKKFSQMTGCPQETIGGKPLADFFHESGHDILDSCLESCVREGKRAELVLKASDGPALPVFLSAHCIQLDGIATRACIVTDIKEKQEQIDETQELFRIAMDNYPAVFIIIDAGRRISFVNSYAIRISGLQKKDILGSTGRGIMPGETGGQYSAHLEKAYETLTPQSCECPVCFPTGIYNLFFDFIPVTDKEQRLKYMFVFGYDIGDFKKTEMHLKNEKLIFEKLVMKRTDELVRAQIELEKSRRLSDLGQLAATVAHELRNPLAAIHMAGVNIGRKAKDGSLDGHVSTIHKKVAESDQIINNLLFYSRLKNPSLQPMNIYDTLVESISTCKTRFFERSIKFILKAEAVKETIVRGDRLQLKETFVNILNNAADAIAESDKGIIEVWAKVNQERLLIGFRDNGTGMNALIREKIFDPFFTTKSKGTGLGLSVCQQVLKHHEGSLEVESEEGKGTLVTVVLPLK